MNSNRRDDGPLCVVMILFVLLLVLIGSAQTPHNDAAAPADSADLGQTAKVVTVEAPTAATNPGEAEGSSNTKTAEPTDSAETTAIPVATLPGDGAADSILDRIPIVGDVVALGNSTLPQVTDYSYFRLARQHQAQLIPGLDYLAFKDFNHEILPETRQFSSDATEFFYFSEEQLVAEPGTIISTLDCGTAEVTISVPVLPEALQEFVDQRGERCLMSYAKYKGDNNNINIEARVMVYSGTPGIIICPQQEMFVAGIYDSNFGNSLFYELAHDVYPSQSEVSGTPVASDVGLYCYMGASPTQDIDREYPYTCLASYRNGKSIEELASEDALALGVSECTPTSFTPTAAQIERLIAGVEEFEARPLPDKFFASSD